LWIGTRLAGLGDVPLPLTVLIVCLGVTFLTEVTSNTATATLLLPILAAAAVGMGVHPFLLMVPATLSASCAFMLPVATPPNAIVFGSPWVTIPRMARTGFVLNLVGAVLITLLTLGPLRAVFDVRGDNVPEWAVPQDASGPGRGDAAPLVDSAAR
jgi:sodium-dependent dicarboxylate transporter 2/3/5